MNNVLKITLIVLVVLIAAGALFYGGWAWSRAQQVTATGAWTMPMMGGYGWGQSQRGYGPGEMMGRGHGMTGQWYGYGPNYPTDLTPLSVDEARQAAEAYLAGLSLAGLEIHEIMVFDNHAYVMVIEESTGLGAFELLVDPLTRIAYPEYGPNVMWNLKYGGINHVNMMGGRGGMMGGWGWSWEDATPADVSAEMPVSEEQALQAAQQYLDIYLPGATVADEAMQFYGYYRVDFLSDGKPAGMLSVNGYSQTIFVHTWHGSFVEEWEAE